MFSRFSTLARIPKGVWVLGGVSLLMDVSSEMIHSLLPLFMSARWTSNDEPSLKGVSTKSGPDQLAGHCSVVLSAPGTGFPSALA